MTVCTGLERLLVTDSLRTKAGPSAWSPIRPASTRGIDLLAASDRFQLSALIGPEHGVRDADQAGVHVADAVDARTGLPVHSLYGATSKPTPAMLAGLEALVFDIQDVGVRFATYASTLWLVQEAGAEADPPVVVLDRPNPIAGERVEGNLVEAGFDSFVGIHPIPIRHGLTFGELRRVFAADRNWLLPRVVPMLGWQCNSWFDETGPPWVLPSPNLPTPDSVTLYPGTCLIEGTTLSEGRGTTRPFEPVGAPWVGPYRLASELDARRLSGVAFRATWFAPTFSTHQDMPCGGVQVHLLDRAAVRPVELESTCCTRSGPTHPMTSAGVRRDAASTLSIACSAATDHDSRWTTAPRPRRCSLAGMPRPPASRSVPGLIACTRDASQLHPLAAIAV